MRRGSKRGGSPDLDTARARGDLRCDLKRRCRRRAQGPDGAVVVDTGQVVRWRTGSCCVEGAMQRRGRREVRMRRSGWVLDGWLRLVCSGMGAAQSRSSSNNSSNSSNSSNSNSGAIDCSRNAGRAALQSSTHGV
ncbi:hypothetical protein HBI34_007800 [Parastagonospora nodorum]|nr:hypothetical protein HBI34_007800 [Parastagonospora nodorum]